jgi:hypothetical protein
LDALGYSGKPDAHEFARMLMERMTGTANLALLILSYLVTRAGVMWYRSLPDAGGHGHLSSKESVRSLTDGLVEQFRVFLTADAEIWHNTWNDHLTESEFPFNVSDWIYWSQAYRTHARPDDPRQPVGRTWLVGVMAKILLRLPVSEAEVERLFSLMRSVFGSRSQAARETCSKRDCS